MDLSLSEILLIVVVAVVFIGPKELPAVARSAAKGMRALRGLTRDIRKAFDELAEESGVKDAADSINAEMRMIQGDDGKFYESYDPSQLPGKRHEQ